MNVMLTRLPDGTVNAEPGDAVEYWSGGQWVSAVYCKPLSGILDDRVILKTDFTYDIEISRIRHAIGGAGHLRLQVARLRQAVKGAMTNAKRMETSTAKPNSLQGEDYFPAVVYTAMRNVLADIDNYEFEEPQP